MRDAIALQASIGVAVAVSVGLAIVPHEVVAPAPIPIGELPETPRSEAVTVAEPAIDPTCACDFTGTADPDQRRALELACLQHADEGCRFPFEVFATRTLGPLRGVFVRRSTGDCGGCGALTIAVMFRGDELELIERLGEYGRFGNGPEAIRLRSVAGSTVIEVDDSISMGGHTSTYRSFFTVDRDVLEERLCLDIAGSDRGARERASEWSSTISFGVDGTLSFVPRYTQRGEETPVLRSFRIPFEHGRWRRPQGEGACIDPRSVDEPIRL